MSYVSEIEYYVAIAKRYSNRDDGLDDDFIEEEWQFVRDADTDDDDDDLFDKPTRPDFYIDDDEDEDEGDEDDGDWDDSDEDDDEEDDDDNFDDWIEEGEDEEPDDEE